MTEFSVILSIMVYIVFSIMIIWGTSLLIIEKKKITPFLPFLLIGFTFCFYAAFIFYDILNGSIGLILEMMCSISLIWIIVIFVRRKYGLT